MAPRSRRQISVAIVMLLAASCGGSSASQPTSPTQFVMQNWIGTWTFVTSGVTVADNVHVSFIVGTDARGSWLADSGPTGLINMPSLPTGTAASGTLTITETNIRGETCSAQGAVSATGTATTMEIAIGAMPSTSACEWATDQHFSLKKT
jgi:hypothetical protein